MAVDLNYWLQPALTDPRTYGLFFLLGSFTVASLSDIRRMSAQREFSEVWLVAVVALLLLDAYLLRGPEFDRLLVKWGLIAALCLFSYRPLGLLFKLEWGDVAAIAAICALLSPLMVPIFFVILKVVNFVEMPILKGAGSQGAYPFMPVVTTASLAAFPVATYLQTLNLVF